LKIINIKHKKEKNLNWKNDLKLKISEKGASLEEKLIDQQKIYMYIIELLENINNSKEYSQGLKDQIIQL